MNIILLLSTFIFNKYAFCGFKTHICLHRDILHLKQAFWNLKLFSQHFTDHFPVCQQETDNQTENIALGCSGSAFLPYLLSFSYIRRIVSLFQESPWEERTQLNMLSDKPLLNCCMAHCMLKPVIVNLIHACKPSVEPQFKVLVLSLLWLLLCFIVMGQTCCPQ